MTAHRTTSFLGGLIVILAAAMSQSSIAWGHGGEEHTQDVPPAPAATVPSTSDQNKLNLTSELVELVILANEGGLQIYLDQYDTNRPITSASLTIEREGEEFEAEEVQPGFYHVAVPWAASSGSHELLITIDSEAAMDLLEGSLVVTAAGSDSDAPVPAGADGDWNLAGLGAWELAVAGATLVALIVLLNIRRRRAGIAPLLLCLLILPSEPAQAHGDEDHSGDAEPASMVGELLNQGDKAVRFPSGELYLPKANQRTLQIRTQIGQLEKVPTTFQLTAHAIASPNHSGQVQASQDGRVETARVPLPHLGQWVEQGQLIGHIQPIAERFEEGNQQAQQAELRSALRLAERRHTRLIQLQGSVPQREIDEANSSVDSLKARLAAVVKSLRDLEPLYAPISGYITAVGVTPGQIVESQDTLLEIVDPNRMQVEALAYDRMTTDVEKAYGLGRANDPLELKLLGVGVNLKGHAIPMLFDVVQDNPPLAIGEAMTVYVSSRQRIEGIVLPRSSLVKGPQGEDLVWTHPQAERFAPKPVRWSVVDEAHIAVTEGLQEGDRVVTKGATLLSQIR